MSEFKIALIGDTHLGELGAGIYDGNDISVPDAELVIGVGDLVRKGHDAEYENALRWAKNITPPFTLVRGNHDNGRWNYYAKKLCMAGIPEKLDTHSESEKLGMVVWKPMIWEEYHSAILNVPQRTNWQQFPVDVQEDIVKLRDLSPGYYAFEAGDMVFICLDTSNWLLGERQTRWIKKQVADANKPVVIIGHHHFLPVGIVYDTCQVHERDFLRKLAIENKKIIAYLHGHAHKDYWWKYANTNIIATRHRACRTVSFKDGVVTGSGLDGKADSPEPFVPRYLCGQTRFPGQMRYLSDKMFSNPWNIPETPCLGWVQPESEEIEIDWNMRLPSNVSEIPHRLTFQIRSVGNILLSVSSPGLKGTIEKDVSPCPDGITVDIEVGALKAGYYEAKLRSRDGWGYVAMAVPINPL